jgi:hypothetical protein
MNTCKQPALKDTRHKENFSDPTTRIIQVASKELYPLPREVGRYFGGPKYKITPKVHDRISKATDAVAGLASPLVGYAVHPVAPLEKENKLLLPKGVALDFPAEITDLQTRYLATCIATLGPALDLACRELTDEGQFYQSMLMDAVGIAMLDRLGHTSRDLLNRQAQQMGLFAGCRFGPGLNGMSLEGQALLFTLTDAQAMGVCLNESFIMEPVKSVSFFMTFSSDENRDHCRHKCRQCTMPDCQFRTAA